MLAVPLRWRGDSEVPDPFNHIKAVGVGTEVWLHVYILSIDRAVVGLTPIRRRNG